jgi:hypothetical protein
VASSAPIVTVWPVASFVDCEGWGTNPYETGPTVQAIRHHLSACPVTSTTPTIAALDWCIESRSRMQFRHDGQAVITTGLR